MGKGRGRGSRFPRAPSQDSGGHDQSHPSAPHNPQFLFGNMVPQNEPQDPAFPIARSSLFLLPLVFASAQSMAQDKRQMFFKGGRDMFFNPSSFLLAERQV